MPVKSNHVYDENDIVLLKGLQGVRKRPAMYIGSTNAMGLHHLVWEIVDNAVDEALSGFGKFITVTIHKDGSLSVQDEGRGIPVGVNKDTGKRAIELVFTELHAGGKFSDKAYTTSAGLHGVGASVTNALSEWLECTVCTKGEQYYIKFANGGKIVEPLKLIGRTNRHGTLVRFKPDATIFSTVDFKWDTIYNHLQESAFLLKTVHFILKDERTGESVEFHYENGLQEYVGILNANNTPLSPVIDFEDNTSHIKMDIAFQYCSGYYDERIYSYVNNVRTRDGGTHETGFRTGITRAVNDYATNNNLLRGKIKLEGSDIREGITAIISLKIPEDQLEFEGQTKGKLGTPEALQLVNNFVYSQFTYYLSENKEFAVTLIKKCIDAQNARIASRKAKEEARNTNKKLKNEVILSGKLTPPQSKDFSKNELFIVEGDSAGGTAKSGRDRMHQGVLPLRGKPLNTDTVAMDKMLKNEEFATLINTIGAGYGQGFDISDAHYDKIIIMTDADTDGAHIQTLLLTFFYHYMRPLITIGHVYIAVPPLYGVSKETKDKQKVMEYAWDDESLDKAKQKVGAGYKIQRYKGLGEMSAEQLWDTTMNPKTRTLIRVNIEDPLLVEYRVGVLMGKDTDVRKKWVEENVDFNVDDEFMKEVRR